MTCASTAISPLKGGSHRHRSPGVGPPGLCRFAVRPAGADSDALIYFLSGVLWAHTVQKSYIFTDDFIGFDGHFPGYPILPAFIQMLIALTLVEELYGKGLNLMTVKNAKFHIPIRPNREMEVECTKRTSGAHIRQATARSSRPRSTRPSSGTSARPT